MERRIAAILAADMVGYSRLVELDEAGTLARQKRHRIELIDPTFERFHGHIVKLTGDGLIAEFGSVVEAVQCAVTIQKEMAAREADQPEDRRIRYRVAVNLGDVVFDEGDVYGDGVNIAARLEQLADPGGVVVSGTAYDLLKNHVDVAYRALGEKTLKNIAAPVRVYAVDAENGAPPPPTPRARRLPLFAAALALACLALGGLWLLNRPDFTPANPDRMAFSLPDKPSIAVKPFEDLTRNDDHGWIPVQLSRSVSELLANSPEIMVISYKSTGELGDVAPSQIAERFGVRYVLDGVVRQSGDEFRVSASLLDTQSGQIMWVDQWDQGYDDIFAALDQIAEAVLLELQVKLTLGEQARGWREFAGSTETMQDMVKGRVEFQKWTPESHALAARYWKDAFDSNPDSPSAPMLVGYVYWQRIMLGLSKDPAADYAEAMRYAQMAIDNGGDGNTYTLKAMLHNDLGHYDEAIAGVREAVAMTPSGADVLMVGGYTLAMSGELDEGIDLMLRGMRLEPDFPEWVPATLALAYLQKGDHQKAREFANAVLEANGVDKRALRRALGALAAIAVWEGQMDTARSHVQTILELFPNHNRKFAVKTVTNRDTAFINRLYDALVAAGLPES
ncbi:hypothetical protein LCL97_13600 [Seohaeicola saemankumensis]|nr:adenylate/guanylate cyclase domain-containing protein [Seohaeicola saemankumensis]MCA0871868.1 hypothetical protein [Seohaeicola saemankumensis]